MIPYITVFAVSAILLAASDRFQITNSCKGAVSTALVVIAVLLPCILAGMRDIGVGTDTRGYGILFFNLVHQSSGLLDYAQLCHQTSWDPEPLFVLLAYSVASITNSLFCYWFAIELLIIVPIYFAIANMCNGRRVWVPFLFYLIVFYGLGLNMMRQGIALSFATLCLSQILTSKNKKAIVSAVCAILFHFSAFIVIFYWMVLNALFTIKNGEVQARSYAKTVVPLFVIGILVFWILIPDLPTILMTFFGERYGYYVNKVGYELHFAYPVFVLGCVLLEIMIYIKQTGKADHLLLLLVAIAISTIALFPITILSQWLVRLSYYPLMAILLLLSVCVSKDRLKISFDLGLLIAGACFVSFYFYIFKGFDEVFPYASGLLGI